MQFKPAAGIYVGGVTMSICGPLLTGASGYFASMAAVRGDQPMASVFIAVAVFGAMLALIGFFMLIVAAYRALAKIDALPMQAHQSNQSEDWPSHQY